LLPKPQNPSDNIVNYVWNISLMRNHNSSAAFGTEVLRTCGWTVLVHVRVRFDSAPLIGNVDTILTNKLAVWKIGVSIDTDLRSYKFLVEEIHQVDVSGRELSCINCVVVE